MPLKTERGKKSLLREELIEAGVAFLNDHETEELTMRKMAELCHVTPHAIYNHFKDKDALLTAISDRILGQMTGLAIDALTRDSAGLAEKMTRFADLYLKQMEKYPYHASMLAAQKNGSASPYYEIERTEDGIIFRGKYPGFPSLKTLNKICTLPPAAIKGLLMLGKMASLLKKPSSEIALREDNAEVARGQIMLFSFIVGIQSEFHSGLIPMEGRHDAIFSLVQSLLDQIV